MKKPLTIIITIAVMLIMAVPLYAAGEMEKSSASKHESGMAQMMSAEDLQGMKVVSQAGEEIGKISKVRIDEQSGEIRFVTLNKGGVLGMGGEEIPVPLEALSFEDQQATLLVDATKLDTAPQQVNISDEEFQRDLQSHYGVSPEWQQDMEGSSGMNTEALDEVPSQINRDSQMHRDPNKNKTDY